MAFYVSLLNHNHFVLQNKIRKIITLSFLFLKHLQSKHLTSFFFSNLKTTFTQGGRDFKIINKEKNFKSLIKENIHKPHVTVLQYEVISCS